MVVRGGDAVRSVLPDGTGAGDGRALPDQGFPARLLLCPDALLEQHALRR